MASFRLYSMAQEALEDIWFYSYTQWDEAQANTYIHQLYDYLQKVANKEYPWRHLPQKLALPQDITYPLYFCYYGKHYIFFRELSTQDIGIITILHEAMDIPARLKEDLQHHLNT